MMRWLPWRWVVRRAARSQGFMDPLAVMARLRRFGQPSEVAEPIELLRAGMIFHARGLINTRVIQHNLDWIWPYWIEQQFDPESPAFLPRAFSITHVNLTHRNWTAVGRPDCAALPIVDPRGLVTPLTDSGSVDAWVRGSDGTSLIPSRLATVDQRLELADDDLCVVTDAESEGLRLTGRARVIGIGDGHRLECRYTASAPDGGRLAVALRPYNPEGISFIHRLDQMPGEGAGDGAPAWHWRMYDEQHVAHPAALDFDTRPDRIDQSDYETGDVANRLAAPGEAVAARRTDCDTGLITAAAQFDLAPGESRTVTLSVPLPAPSETPPAASWAEALAPAAQLDVPDSAYQRLYDQALRTLLMHSVEDIYPGPYTYKRFWFRDAAFIIHGLFNAGLIERGRRALARFPSRQTRATGYFHSQEGEWDSNGQALWIIARHYALTGEWPPGADRDEWQRVIRRGVQWVARKRLPTHSDRPEAGLLPAGFSAEHLGPNDYYYWDDQWAFGGLRAATALMRAEGEATLAEWIDREADDLGGSLERAYAADRSRLGGAMMPASPRRRMDAGAIGSIAAGFPLQTMAADDKRLLGTVRYLLGAHRVNGGFFQEMIHSGVNAYLTLHLAQVLLRAGDDDGLALIDAVAHLASPTGQWPEAIHPRTGGGCMGDGQHVWAAAEWVSMMRNAFCREEGDGLVLGAGVQPRWLAARTGFGFGPTPTIFGAVSVRFEPMDGGGHRVRWTIEGDGAGPAWIRLAVPGQPTVDCALETGEAVLPEADA
ncbi:hypothetical protein EV698_1944 [Spiribacter vilamensis]|uniref:Uncharacterized protein n=2 Tax=Spiribacter vilamensis TaxID=531306 RepID=A0A4Q8D2M7_9GAMM|nr:hypothetical protein EV698_1944 [Spiribacter vilamensis]